MTMPSPILVSVIVPVLNEGGGVESLLRRLRETLSLLPSYQWELVVVDDGSTDDSVARLRQHAPLFPGRVHLLSFSRNFGHQRALLAGLQQAQGDAIIMIDADLQDPPELFSTFLEKFQEGYEVVFGIRRRRQEGFWKVLGYKIFYRIFDRLAEVPIPLDAGDFGLISRRVAQILGQMEEQDVFLRGLRGWVGFRQTGVPYDRPARVIGETKYNLRRLLRLAASAFFGYSSLPLRVATGLGLVVMILAVVYAALALYGSLVLSNNPPGWTSLIIVILLFSGVQLLTIGILGEYIGRIYKQSLRRPLYLTQQSERLQ
jgi:dolichol-phosphate mannosyltransferase